MKSDLCNSKSASVASLLVVTVTPQQFTMKCNDYRPPSLSFLLIAAAFLLVFEHAGNFLNRIIMQTYLQIERTHEWNKSCCFPNTDKHWLRDERRNQWKHLSAGAKLLRQGAETDIRSDGKRLLSAISEIRNVPSSPGTGWTAMKATRGEKKLVRRLSEWLILHFSRLSLESQFKQKRLVCQRMQEWKEIRSCRYEDWQDLKAKHDLNNVLSSFLKSIFVWVVLYCTKKRPVIQKRFWKVDICLERQVSRVKCWFLCTNDAVKCVHTNQHFFYLN